MCSAVEYLGFDEVEEFFGGIMGIIYKAIKINNQKLILAEYGLVDNFPVRIAQFQLPQMENRKYSTGLKIPEHSITADRFGSPILCSCGIVTSLLPH
ncbi:hypothetical protein PY092_16360 [Muricauda sp. 334s03]|jgi:hypothetical protein|uniref:Uncharacterized protein n=1 Tax=Flagellimonas yonaguniensis TaxID=3031325 RepID=A0ABT5Y2Q8_9FLAO|nr:hypothetical protein [[Muricauda] yonaguniensis]MDF0717737.1 hypothetical protein [[Muricauda] yonaguniensis]